MIPKLDGFKGQLYELVLPHKYDEHLGLLMIVIYSPF